ncbi:MAG: threonine/serine exporter family protein [bacterium]
MYILREFILAFLSTVTFSVMFNTPKKELLYCGLIGAIGWFVYSVSLINGGSSLINNFLGSFFIAYLSKFFAVARKNPMSIFIIPGVITLVPGAAIYRTVLNLIMNEHAVALHYGLETITIACAIALGIIVALSVSNFNIKKIIRNN